MRADDPSLNVDTSPASYTFEVVGSALTTIGASVPPDPATTTSRTASFTFTSNQAVSMYECSLDGAEFFACTSGVTYTNLTFEGHTFEVRSTNIFGLVEEPPTVFEWTIALPPDAIPPETTILGGPADLHTESSATFTFAADRAGSTFECALDLEAFQPCSSGKTYTDLAEGEHVLSVQAISPEGWPDPSPATHEFTVDLPPQTNVDSGPPSLTLNPTAFFSFSSNEAGASFECSLDGAAFGSCGRDQEFANLTPGLHELLVRAVDSSGTPDATPAEYSWRIGPPIETTILSAPDEVSDSTTATFRFSSPAADVTYECALDEAVENQFFTPCPNPQTYTDLLFGEHEFLVRAVDAAGNVDQTPAEWSWEVGGIPPPVMIESGSAARDREPQRDLHLLRRGHEPQVRVRAQRRDLLALLVAEDLQRRPGQRSRPAAHVPGAGARGSRGRPGVAGHELPVGRRGQRAAGHEDRPWPARDDRHGSGDRRRFGGLRLLQQRVARDLRVRARR